MPVERFPAIELVPKRETQLLDFLASNEQSDGRGIVIAVLDQGKMVHFNLFSANYSLQPAFPRKWDIKNAGHRRENL